MTDLDKLNDKEKDTQDTAMTDLDLDTLSKVSGGNLSDLYPQFFKECPNCHLHLYYIPGHYCSSCNYRD